MTTTVTPEPAVWQSRDELTPADMAALYRQAAEIIRTRSYDQYDEYEHAHGVSITTALRLAASRPVTDPRDAADLAEELETRLAGVLYVTGQAFCRTGIRDLSDTVASWERASVRSATPPPSPGRAPRPRPSRSWRPPPRCSCDPRWRCPVSTDDSPVIAQDHEIILTLTRDQFITLMGALGAADVLTSEDGSLIPEDIPLLLEAIQNPILQDLIANLQRAADSSAGRIHD